MYVRNFDVKYLRNQGIGALGGHSAGPALGMLELFGCRAADFRVRLFGR